MNSYQLLENIRHFRDFLESFEDIEIKITEISDFEDQINIFNKQILKLTRGNAPSNQCINNFESELDETKKLIKKIRYKRFFCFCVQNAR